MLALGRRYGLVGRNGTGKTTFLRALASKSIKGIPDNVQASLGPFGVHGHLHRRGGGGGVQVPCMHDMQHDRGCATVAM